MTSPSPQNTNQQLETVSIDCLTQQTYIETWLSPAAFHRIWEKESLLPIRYHFDIDIDYPS
jgi:hypothetical protein